MGVTIGKLNPTIDIYDFSADIIWQGWKTTWADLRRNGWVINIEPPFNDWKQPKHCEASKEKIYIRHPVNRMIGRITKHERKIYDDGQVWELDFLIQEHNWRKSAPKLLDERNLTDADIPMLLQVILALQSTYKKRKKPIEKEFKKAAEILLFDKAV